MGNLLLLNYIIDIY